jgi:hypothetical protein
MRLCLKEDTSMEWIFVVSGIGSLGLLSAQLVEYIVESKRGRKAILYRPAFFSEVPPGDALPSAEVTAWYDQAA